MIRNSITIKICPPSGITSYELTSQVNALPNEPSIQSVIENDKLFQDNLKLLTHKKTVPPIDESTSP